MNIFIPPYTAPFLPAPNITPFTYRDGATFLERVERFINYVNTEIVGVTNDNINQLGDDFQTQMALLVTSVNASVESIIAGDVEVSDSVIATVIDDLDSATRELLDSLYLGTLTNADVAAFVTDVGATKTALDAAYITTNAQVAAFVTGAGATKTALDAAYSGGGGSTNAEVAAYVTGAGATKTALDSAYAGQEATNADIAAFVTGAGPTKTALDTAYAGQEATNADVAAFVTGAGATKTALDSAYGGGVESVVAGSNIVVDNTDPDNPIVSLPVNLIQATGNQYGIDVVTEFGSGSLRLFATEVVLKSLNVFTVGTEVSLTTNRLSVNTPFWIASFATVDLPDPSSFEDGHIVFDTDESVIKVTISGVWTALGGGGGFDPNITDIAIGLAADVTGGANSIVIGASAETAEDESIAIGHNAIVTAANAAMIGEGTNGQTDTIRFGYETVNFASGSVELTPNDVGGVNLNGWHSIGNIYIIGGVPPVSASDSLQVGTMAWDDTLNKPLWLKSVEVDPADNVWVDATGATVYP